MGKVKLSKEQLSVVQADPKSRLLVEAGPGTGKTEVACARSAWLIQNGHAKAHQILFVSYTRAAVKESRDRIASYLGDSTVGSSVKISTLDSFAGKLLSGFGPKGINRQSYDENISSLIDLMEREEELRDYLSSFRHIIVDEGQDTYPPRSELVQELIWLISENGGATVFFDLAQSIYGWRDEVEDASDDDPLQDLLNLPTTIRLFSPDTFEHKSLSRIHRASSPELQRLFTEGREILTTEQAPEVQLDLMNALVKNIAEPSDTAGTKLEASLAASNKDSFFLFERNAEALSAAGYLTTSEYRIRLTRQEPQIFPWVGILLWDWLEDEMTLPEFSERYSSRILENYGSESLEETWQLLLNVCEHESRSNVLDVPLLARRLSSSPPLEMVMPAVGHTGPIFSTIHGAKGLQAEEVNLFLSKALMLDVDDDEVARKARVVFVGASRAKKTLRLAETTSFGGRLPSGRAKMSYRNSRLGLEIGRRGDLNASGLVGKDSFESEAEALASQRRIESMHQTRIELKSEPRKDQNLIHDLFDSQDGFRLGSLSSNVGWDLRNASGQRTYYRPGLMHIRSLGVHTLAVAPTEVERSQLHYPWNQSGFLLSPSLTGLPLVFRRKGRY
jgi:hypothetical protein